MQEPPLQSLFSIVFTTTIPFFPSQKKKNMLSKLLIAVTAIVVAVNAQSPSSSAVSALPSLSPCVTECVTNAATLDGCGSLYVSWHIHSHLAIILIIFFSANITCVCASSQFQVDAAACIQEHCTTADLQTALTLQQAECAAGIIFFIVYSTSG